MSPGHRVPDPPVPSLGFAILVKQTKDIWATGQGLGISADRRKRCSWETGVASGSLALVPGSWMGPSGSSGCCAVGQPLQRG